MGQCTICKTGGDITSGVGTGDGLAHPWCYEREHPPRAATNLYIVARGASDPVLAAEVIAEVVPADFAAEIVARFNDRLMRNWLRRCEERL